MIKIGVVSDTHSHPLPDCLLHDFYHLDMIVHAGDFCSVEDLNVFKAIGEVKAVHGNMDDYELHQLLPERDIFTVDEVKIGLCHGHGQAGGHALDFVKKSFKNDKVDVVIFGHSHEPINKIIDGVLYFNPGSVTDVVYAPYRSYGILEIKGRKVSGKIVKIK